MQVPDDIGSDSVGGWWLAVGLWMLLGAAAAAGVWCGYCWVLTLTCRHGLWPTSIGVIFIGT